MDNKAIIKQLQVEIKISSVLDIQIKDNNIILIDNEFEERIITLSFDEVDEIIKQYTYFN
jgi:hypothetical protein